MKHVVMRLSEIVPGVAERWHRTYYDAANDKWRYGDDKRVIWEKLCALESPAKSDVDAIIGNDSWTECRCNECNSDVEVLVRFGDEPDYDSQTAYVCEGCLRSALEQVQS